MTYSVTPSDVSARIHGFLLDATSVPTIDTVAELISESEAMVNGYLVHKGVGLPLAPGGYGYTIARSVALDLACSKTELARSRRPTEYVKEVWERGKETLDLIMDHPSIVDAAAESGRAANMAFVSGDRGGCCRPRLTRAQLMARRGDR